MIPVAVGAAWAFKLDGSDRVAVTFFGDGAVEEGVFYESLNFAAVHRLPIIFVCENNQYATHSALAVRQPATDITDRFEGFCFTRGCDDDPRAVRGEAELFVERCRRGWGPALLEVQTYRYREHVGPIMDRDAPYRNQADYDDWLASDPLRTVPDQPEDVQEITAAIAAAEAADWPSVTW